MKILQFPLKLINYNQTQNNFRNVQEIISILIHLQQILVKIKINSNSNYKL